MPSQTISVPSKFWSRAIVFLPCTFLVGQLALFMYFIFSVHDTPMWPHIQNVMGMAFTGLANSLGGTWKGIVVAPLAIYGLYLALTAGWEYCMGPPGAIRAFVKEKVGVSLALFFLAWTLVYGYMFSVQLTRALYEGHIALVAAKNARRIYNNVNAKDVPAKIDISDNLLEFHEVTETNSKGDPLLLVSDKVHYLVTGNVPLMEVTHWQNVSQNDALSVEDLDQTFLGLESIFLVIPTNVAPRIDPHQILIVDMAIARPINKMMKDLLDAGTRNIYVMVAWKYRPQDSQIFYIKEYCVYFRMNFRDPIQCPGNHNRTFIYDWN